eukprot:GEMP01041248.1.p1 GENE.GEMP01041248.1~~GEMP01041248.1.p1  ORF type:complete len:491 (+),score=81.66 GEMP01041248.1:188-1660(+)
MAWRFPPIFGIHNLDPAPPGGRWVRNAENGQVIADGEMFDEGEGRNPGRPVPFPIIFGRTIQVADENDDFRARIQIQRIDLAQPDNNNVRRPWRFLATIGMLLCLIAYFRSQRNKRLSGKNFDEYLAPFPWDDKAFAENGIPYETLFLDPTSNSAHPLLRSSKESYIGDATKAKEVGALSLLGSAYFLTARPTTSNSTCISLFQARNTQGPWEERRQSFCQAAPPVGDVETALLGQEIRSSGPLEEGSLPLAAYWRTVRNTTAEISCLAFWDSDIKEPKVLAVEAKFDYCFVDHVTKFLVCFTYTDTLMRWNAWNFAMEHQWQLNLSLLSSNFALVRSPTTGGYAVMTHLHNARRGPPSPTVIIALATGEVYSEERRGKEGNKIRRHRSSDNLDDPFSSEQTMFPRIPGGRRLAEHFIDAEHVELIHRFGLCADAVTGHLTDIVAGIFAFPDFGSAETPDLEPITQRRRLVVAASHEPPAIAAPELCVVA